MKLPRLYDRILRVHVEAHRQMAFVSGPRQVGKTTTCRAIERSERYLNWDDPEDRDLVLRGPRETARVLGLEELRERPVLVVFDELHKFARWKTFLKGLFDRFADRVRIVVTGSSRLDVYRRGGDSLMGRYFLYRMHPLTVGELLRQAPPEDLVMPPKRLAAERFRALTQHGGYPEPFLKNDRRFSLRWQRLRLHQLVREDIRDLSRIQELDQLEALVRILADRSGTQLEYSSLARQVRVSVDTMRRWIATLCRFHYGFLVRPWFRNVAKSLRKEPKWYLRDWSGIVDEGQRAETLIAGHLLKAVHTWEDLGLGTFELSYLRDKLKREVDFVVVRDGEPWFLVEVKHADEELSPALEHFQRQTRANHAFQVIMSAPYVDATCFERSEPCIVPARTLLSQLP